MSDVPKTAVPPTVLKATWERISRICFILGASVLLFLLGGILVHSNGVYSRFLGSAIAAYHAILAQNQIIAEEYPTFLWNREPTRERGLIRFDREKSSPGYTLCLAADGGKAVLLDHAGGEAHRWEVPFNTVWPDPPHVHRKAPDSFFPIRRGHVYPNGDLLALYASPAQSPHGCGLARVDRDGRVIWTLDANAHHDFDVADDGTIYVLTESISSRSLGPAWQLVDYPFVEEWVTVVSADGTERETFSLFELLERSKYHRSTTSSSMKQGDVLHSNTVNIIGESFAAHHDGISPGDLMICLRNLNLVIVVNPARKEIVWATSGPWSFPHDPDPLPNGNIMIFDNCFHRGSIEGSRVLEFVPDITGAVAWQYFGSVDAPLRSTVRSVQQVLPNDNVLITESDRGRVLEVTRGGEIVWEYVHPARCGPEGNLIPIVCSARRYSADELPFLAERGEASRVAVHASAP